MTDNILTIAMIKEAVEELKKSSWQVPEMESYILSPQEWELWKEKGLI